jgi:putative FmdB family regulatory protein
MPIYEFACPKCRRIFNFLSKRVNPAHSPVCPRCGNRNLEKQVSRFAFSRRFSKSGGGDEDQAGEPPLPDFDNPRVERAMRELERDMEHLDENNPRHMAQVMKKMREIMPSGAVPKELDAAIKRLEAGEDPEKVEADLGDVLDNMFGGGEEGAADGGYTRDSGLYDY